MSSATGATGPWSIAEARARLSELLRMAQRDPQVIGQRGQRFVVVPIEQWEGRSARPLTQWLAEQGPGPFETDLERPKLPMAKNPFEDEAE